MNFLVYIPYYATHHIKGFEAQQRLVLSFKKEDLHDTPRFNINNRTNWHASGIMRISHWWSIETFA